MREASWASSGCASSSRTSAGACGGGGPSCSTMFCSTSSAAARKGVRSLFPKRGQTPFSVSLGGELDAAAVAAAVEPPGERGQDDQAAGHDQDHQVGRDLRHAPEL